MPAAPFIGTLESLRMLRSFQADPIGLMTRLRRERGDLAGLRVGHKRIFFCFHPDHAERVLKDASDRYRKSRLVFDKITPLTGRKGLVQLEGAEAREQRGLTGASLSHEAIAAAYPMLAHATLEGVGRILADEGREIDLMTAMTGIVLRNAQILVLGKDPGPGESALGAAFLEANAVCGAGIRSLVGLPGFVPTASNRRLRGAIATLDAAIHAAIRSRRAEIDPAAKDLLSLLVRAGLPDQRIRDHVITFLFAGHETTASSLTWTLYLLARHPEAAERVRAEILAATAGETPRLEQLRGLRHTLNAYQESLRLFPPSWTLAREAVADDELGGVRVPKGSLLLVGVGDIHRDGRFWKRGETFDPTRFEEDDGRHPYAFIPFGGGSRICIGMRTALMEAALVLALVVPKVRFHPRPGFEARVEAMITAHPKDGMPVRVERRPHADASR